MPHVRHSNARRIRRALRPRTPLLGLLVIAIGIYLLVRQLGMDSWFDLWPLLVIILGIYFILKQSKKHLESLSR